MGMKEDFEPSQVVMLRYRFKKEFGQLIA